jgi:hypothetical protein
MKIAVIKNIIATTLFALFLVGYVAWFAEETGVLTSLSGSSYHRIPQTLYSVAHSTREASGIVINDKAGEFYEYEAELVFENRAAYDGKVGFTFFWDVVAGFDEEAVTFNVAGVSYSVGESRDGWRMLKIRCEGVNAEDTLKAKLVYSAEALMLRDTEPGYYKWELDALTETRIPELEEEMASFKTPYACANWIKKNIEYVDHASNPQPAASTFRLGQGDCDDIAVLFCYMMKRLYPEMDPRVVEGWTLGGRYHANVAIRTRAGWLLLDPSLSSVKFGVFDFHPFVPAGRLSEPFLITDESGNPIETGGVGIAFGSGNVSAA